MMEKVHVIYDFQVPKEKVFNFFNEHERLSEIYPGAFKRIVNSNNSTNANGVGSVRRMTNFPLVLDEMITQHEYPNLIEYKVIKGGYLKFHKGIMRFYDRDNGAKCRLDYVIEFESKVPLMGFVLKNIVQSGIANALSLLGKKFIENPNY